MNEKKLLKSGIVLMTVMIVSFYIYSMKEYLPVDFGYNPEFLIVSLCPVLWYGLAKYIGKKTEAQFFIVGFVIFNTVVVGFIFLTEEVLFKCSFESADIVAQFYMYVTAIIAFDLHGIFEKKYFCSVREIIFMGLIVAVVLGVWMLCEERTASIIDSFGIDKNATDTDGEYLNWISHRKAMFDAVLKGDFSYVNPHRLAPMTKGCPVAMIRAMGMWYVFPVIFCMYCALTVLMILYATKSRSAFVTVVTISFVLKIVIGAISNTFLIFSTSVGFPFIRTVFDVIPLAIILFFNSEKRNC